MVRLIVGLGNPGRQYENTRHNVGFLVLDSLASAYSAQWRNESKFEGLTSECNIDGVGFLLLKPQTYMNKSGSSVGKIARFYKISPEQIVVVHDELDFDVGVIKLKKNGGHAGHNGLRDIIANLGSGNFYRIRLGIGRPKPGCAVADYVLSCPSKIESEKLSSAIECGMNSIQQMAKIDLSILMNQLNTIK